jgi:hypothetical protein
VVLEEELVVVDVICLIVVAEKRLEEQLVLDY